MHATNVRNLKKNPSLALRQAEESPVLILKGNEPNAIIVHLDKSLVDAERSVRPTGVTVCLAIFLRCGIHARFQLYYHGPDKAGYTVCDR